LARIWHSDLHLAAQGRAQPHIGTAEQDHDQAENLQVRTTEQEFELVGRVGLEPTTGGL
jgi:hypothetical protein